MTNRNGRCTRHKRQKERRRFFKSLDSPECKNKMRAALETAWNRPGLFRWFDSMPRMEPWSKKEAD